MWGWIKSASQNPFVQSVMEKTKTGVDRMITTLDPGMTSYMRLGGDIFIVVASEKEVKWGAIRDAFQVMITIHFFSLQINFFRFLESFWYG